jgi:hypothetical protein
MCAEHERSRHASLARGVESVGTAQRERAIGWSQKALDGPGFLEIPSRDRSADSAWNVQTRLPHRGLAGQSQVCAGLRHPFVWK